MKPYERVKRARRGAENRPVLAERVPIIYPCVRCCATGCGDKIKGTDATSTMWKITWSDGGITYLEETCATHFVGGHPDYGGAHGPVPGLPTPRARRSRHWRPGDKPNVIVTRRDA